MSWAQLALLAVALAGFLARWTTWRALRRIRPLPAGAPDDRDLPSVAVVAAARNEAAGVGPAMRSWLRQDVPILEVILVDDRSTDGTAAIALEAAAGDARVRVLRVEERPVDWLGKCHALHVGASAATADYVLFTDADVELLPGCLRRAVTACRRDDADHLVLLPDVVTRSLAQGALTTTFMHAFLLLAGGRRVNDDRGGSLLGVGAFNLVRRSAWLAVGGHESVRLQVGDDVALARLLALHGFRQRAHDGRDVARVEWQRGGILATLRGLEKNAFWGARLSVGVVVGATLVTLGHLTPLLAPLWGAWGWLAFAAWWAGAALPHLADRRSLAATVAGTVLLPLSCLLLLAAVWHSAASTLRQGGIRWRDDFVPLQLLRANLKPLSWWYGDGARTRDKKP